MTTNPAIPPIPTDTVGRDTLVAANPTFLTGPLHQRLWGRQHRQLWATPTARPLFDVERIAGGLQPVKKGGGMSSNTLRMVDSVGREYVLRSVNKDYRRLIPPAWAELKLLNILQDQNSASHPFGALLVPALSRAAGVYYTEPEVGYLPQQPGLGELAADFVPGLYLLEERPDGDRSDNPAFGRATRIIGYEKLLERLRESPNHVVDQRWVCKSRLLDLLIHDWDRHDDQWRWAAFETRDKTVYRPIPRDRDQAFFRFEGWIPTYLATFIVKKLKTMRPRLRDVEHHAFNARHFDRSFLNELAWADWAQEIAAFQRNTSDAALVAAVGALPPELGRAEQARTLALLRARRADLPRAGYRLYRYLAEEVEIVGTDHADVFDVQYLPNGSVRVRVATQLPGDSVAVRRYERLFFAHETRELRLYGLGGQDAFRTSGDATGRIRVRVIGGDGADVVDNAAAARLHIYDTPPGIATRGPGCVDQTANDTLVNVYDRTAFAYDTRSAVLRTGFTRDDQWWWGAGMTWTRHAWRRAPYRAQHRLLLAAAPTRRPTLQVEYDGHWPEALGRWALAPRLTVAAPRHENYFGIGNDTTNPLLDWPYHWVPLQSATAALYLRRGSPNGQWRVQAGPVAETHTIRPLPNHVTTDATLGFKADALLPRYFAGTEVQVQADASKGELVPTRGLKGQSTLKALWQTDTGAPVVQFDADARGYLSVLPRQRLVLAARAGYRRVWGQPQFYQYPALGHDNGLRGFRNERFRGDWAAFANLDARLQVLTWRNAYLPMHIGLVLGYDAGRVGELGTPSATWHGSSVVGLWFNVLDLVVLHPLYAFNREQRLLGFKFGFGF